MSGTFEGDSGEDPSQRVAGTWETSKPESAGQRNNTHGPSRGSVILFIFSVVGALLVVITGTWFAVYTSNNNAQRIAANQQQTDQRWCDTLGLLTKTPVPAPAHPAANPSRENQYKLYLDFLALRKDFGCS